MQSDKEELIFHQSRCISHEIRNHLSICELYSEIIRKNMVKENIQNESIENALSCIQKSLRVINNSLLDLKSLNNLKMQTCNLKQLVTQGAEMARIYSQDKNIDLTTDINTDALVNVDENKFLACIVNIIKNAIEAIEEKGTIKITTTVGTDIARILISNNGTPISEEKQKEIFKEGFTTKSTGCGLGLYICKSSLKEQGADLKLVKSDNDSTEFEITLQSIVNGLSSTG